MPIRVDFLKYPLLTCIALVELCSSNSILVYDYLGQSAQVFCHGCQERKKKQIDRVKEKLIRLCKRYWVSQK